MKHRPTKIIALFLSLVFMIAIVCASALTPDDGADSVPDATVLSAGALNALMPSVKANTEIAAKYAYLDISAASPALEDVILAARENIIYHSSWFNRDVCSGGVVTDSDGNVLRELPAFQDIFPADWNVPVSVSSDERAAQDNASAISAIARAPTTFKAAKYRYIDVKNPSTDRLSDYYARVSCITYDYSEGVVGQYVDRFDGMLNLGIVHLFDYVDAGFVENVTEGDRILLNVPGFESYGMRVSTYGTPQSGDFTVVWSEEFIPSSSSAAQALPESNPESEGQSAAPAVPQQKEAAPETAVEIVPEAVSAPEAISEDNGQDAARPAVQGWYNPEYASGAWVVHKDGSIQELPSYQELFPGQSVPKTEPPPFYCEFLLQDFCEGATLINTDNQSSVILTPGMTYVCYSRSDFFNAVSMPYPNIEDNVVYADISAGELYDLQPGTIYICE